jgi:hypothetical protein
MLHFTYLHCGSVQRLEWTVPRCRAGTWATGAAR